MDVDELKTKLVKCLTEQINEIDLFKSMYSKKGEILITDPSALQEVRDILDNQTYFIPRHIDFTLNLYVDKMKLEVSINLPTFYPETEPNINVRCNQLNRQQESNLNKEISSFIKNNHDGEVCLFTVIVWLQENIEVYKNQLETQDVISVNIPNHKAQMFARFWIYSHHIYNKKKREEIVKKAKEFNITGFCLSGKPGIICIEGAESDCREWWKIIKSMCWKKIVIKKIELFKPTEQTKEQRFTHFEEIGFHNPSIQSRKHSDMNQLSRYIEEHSLTHVFKEFMGFVDSL